VRVICVKRNRGRRAMNLENINKEELNEKIEILLRIIINDLKDLKEPSEAGWRKLSDLNELGISEKDLTKLQNLGIIEKNLVNEFRVIYKDKKIRQGLSTFNTQFQQIDYFIENLEMLKQDFERLQKADEIVQEIVSRAQEDKKFLSFAIAIGIWRMLNTSDMPAVVDNVLSAGFSPKDWGVISLRSAPYLSLELAKKVAEVEKLEDAFNYMKTIRFIRFISETPNLDKLDIHNVSRVKKVLRWQKICEMLNEENIKFLGLSWFAVFILEENDALPSYIDFSAKVANIIKECITKILRADYPNLANNLTDSLMELEEQYDICWASGIIFLPEVL